jgi:hypothetical protein
MSTAAPPTVWLLLHRRFTPGQIAILEFDRRSQLGPRGAIEEMLRCGSPVTHMASSDVEIRGAEIKTNTVAPGLWVPLGAPE